MIQTAAAKVCPWRLWSGSEFQAGNELSAISEGTPSAYPPCLTSPTASPDHFFRNVRKPLSACKSDGADPAS